MNEKVTFLLVDVELVVFFIRLDDLLVGAPLYIVKKEGRILVDAGRVDIFYQTTDV